MHIAISTSYLRTLRLTSKGANKCGKVKVLEIYRF